MSIYGSNFVYGESTFYKDDGTLTVYFNANKTYGFAQLDVEFEINGGSEFGSTTVMWDFGDGETSAEISPTHTYETIGVYTVTLTVWFNEFVYSVVTRENYITVLAAGLYPFRTNKSFTVGLVDIFNSISEKSMETNKSFNLAMNYEQGIGFSENDGYWPMPETRTGVVSIIDDLEYPHVLVMDYTDGKFYDIYSRDASVGSDITRQTKDKVEIDNTGGYDIAPEVTFKEDTGEYEKFITEILSNRFYIRPMKETNRDASGYDSNGYMDGIEFTSYIYVDGAPTVETAKAKDISITGEVVYDKKAEGHRLYTKISSNKTDFQLVGRQQTYITKDIVYDLDNRQTTENDYQYNISSPILWFTRGKDKELINNVDVSVASHTTGPDSRTNSAALVDSLSIASVPATANKYLMLFGSGTVGVTVGATPISLSTYDTDSGWSLYYASGINASGTMTISGSNIGLFDIRMFSSAKSTDDLEYMFDDVTKNGADNVCPWF